MSFPLVSAQWLEEHLDDQGILVIDVSVDKVVGKEPITYDTLVTIPSSIKVCIEQQLSDTETEGIHVFPTGKQIAQLASKLFITKKSKIVLFDNQGIYSSPRAWWILKSYGFDSVYILDGGLPEWIRRGLPTTGQYREVPSVLRVPAGENASDQSSPSNFELASGSVKRSEDLVRNLAKPHDGVSQEHIVVDVRAEARFYGRVEEPREGLRKGHIPNAVNLPFLNVLDGHGYCDKTTLIKRFEAALSDFEATLVDSAVSDKSSTDNAVSLVFSCGSGMTACIVLVAAILAGYEQVSLYDGSWAEWGANPNLPIETD